MVLSEWLVPKKVVTAQVVAEFLKEAEDISYAVDSWQVQGMLLMIKHSW